MQTQQHDSTIWSPLIKVTLKNNNATTSEQQELTSLADVSHILSSKVIWSMWSLLFHHFASKSIDQTHHSHTTIVVPPVLSVNIALQVAAFVVAHQHKAQQHHHYFTMSTYVHITMGRCVTVVVPIAMICKAKPTFSWTYAQLVDTARDWGNKLASVQTEQQIIYNLLCNFVSSFIHLNSTWENIQMITDDMHNTMQEPWFQFCQDNTLEDVWSLVINMKNVKEWVDAYKQKLQQKRVAMHTFYQHCCRMFEPLNPTENTLLSIFLHQLPNGADIQKQLATVYGMKHE